MTVAPERASEPDVPDAATAASVVLGSVAEPGLPLRPGWVEVDLDAVRHNVRVLIDRVAPGALMAVVKADGYGHGAVPVARAAVEAGASWLGVALVEEGLELRAAAIDAPILLLSEPPAVAAAVVVASDLTPVVYTHGGIAALADAARHARRHVRRDTPLRVHIKVDTGMRRVGCEPEDVLELARAVVADDALELEGLCTHLAVADEPDHPFTAEQLARFDAVLAALGADGIRPRLRHAANSAALLDGVASYDLARVGIALYGVAPAPVFAGVADLLPALSLRARVSHVKTVRAGERISYGLRHEFATDTRVATVPVGYADGVPRALGTAAGEVLIGGRRRPIVGTVTMDQLMVDVGTDVAVGDEVVLLGRQGDAEIDAAEWAARLDTIAYEIVCGIGPRVPRCHLG